jgi:hypothetical protein
VAEREGVLLGEELGSEESRFQEWGLPQEVVHLVLYQKLQPVVQRLMYRSPELLGPEAQAQSRAAAAVVAVVAVVDLRPAEG